MADLRKVLDYGMKRELVLLNRLPHDARFKMKVREEFEREMRLKWAADLRTATEARPTTQTV